MSEALSLRPRGRNHGGYRGQTIDIRRVLEEIDETARGSGWRPEVLFHSEDMPATAYVLRGPRSGRALYLSAGIHGDEPAGPLAILKLMQSHAWPEHLSVWLCPCLNPAGFLGNRRENAAGVDLNRQYLGRTAEETRCHVAWLERQPRFDLALCLHEDWEAKGFYLYELNPDDRPSLADAMVRRVAAVCPIDLSPEIEGRLATGGIIRPDTHLDSRPQWPEAFYLLAHKTRLSYTLEAPSDFDLPVRVRALEVAVRGALDLGGS